MTYELLPRTAIGLEPVVRSSDGKPRPALSGARWITAHYTGVNVAYGDVGDTAAEIRAIERWAAGQGKPNEYNYVIHQDPDQYVHEYAGAFVAAHSAGENGTAIGVLFLNGIGEPINARQIDKARWLRDVLRYFGVLAGDPWYTAHGDMPGAATACPGPSIRSALASMSSPYRPPAPTPPAPTPPAPTATNLLATVREGEGWWSIARRCYGTNVAANVARLEAANPSTVLRPGALVNVPGRAS